ncbi:MAG: hypothetical protein KJ957_05520 [Candidatus Omnitrophica bacterium]|nr:hypothetical protein [Candidatus Omnitrophota bacterium]
MKKAICCTLILFILVYLACPTFADTSSIESFSKIRTARGYIFKINYSTKEEWTDKLVFKLFCSFNKGVELSFTSSGHNNLKKGWHKTEMLVPKVYRDRYGYIEDYRLEMYHNGILVSMRSM